VYHFYNSSTDFDDCEGMVVPPKTWTRGAGCGLWTATGDCGLRGRQKTKTLKQNNNNNDNINNDNNNNGFTLISFTLAVVSHFIIQIFLGGACISFRILLIGFLKFVLVKV